MEKQKSKITLEGTLDSIEKEIKHLASLSYEERIKYVKEHVPEYDPALDLLWEIGECFSQTDEKPPKNIDNNCIDKKS